MHGIEAPRVLREILRRIISFANCRNLELKLDQLRIEKAQQQVIRPLAIHHAQLEILVMKSLLDTHLGRTLAHFVVFIGRSLHVIHGRLLRPFERRHNHLRQADVFRPGNATILIIPQFLDTEVRTRACHSRVAQNSP